MGLLCISPIHLLDDAPLRVLLSPALTLPLDSLDSWPEVVVHQAMIFYAVMTHSSVYSTKGKKHQRKDKNKNKLTFQSIIIS